MKLRIDTKHQSQPSGGWVYSVIDGPMFSSDKVGEKGLRELIDKLKAYRISNGMPVGDPEHDIAKAYAPKCPWLIIEIDAADDVENLVELWLHRCWRSFPMRMSEARAREDRFEQCVKCPHFKPLDTAGVSIEGMRRLMLLNAPKSRAEYGWCELRKWIPSIAVQIADPWQLADWSMKTPECWLDLEQKK